MTFDSNMQAVEQSAIPELYDITAGGYVYRYTSYKIDQSFLGHLYRAAGIKRSAFTVDQELGSAKVSVSAYMSDPLSSYIGTTPLPSTKVDIYRAVAESMSDYALLFSGVVQRVSGSNKIITAECIQAAKLQSRLPNIINQSYCNWQVFDCDCGLDDSSWAVGATVSEIISGAGSGYRIYSPTFALFADGWFTQGKVYFDGDFRFVTNHTGNALTLHVPFGAGFGVGSSVTAYPGCDGSPSTCLNKFNRRTHHCSMPYIPSHNPVIWGA